MTPVTPAAPRKARAKRASALVTLRRLVPFVRPYRARLTWGLVLVVVGAGFGSVVPWILRAAVDGLGSGAPASRTWALGGLMLGAALVGGAIRYGMREILNGVSRLVETDLRDAVFTHLLSLDAGTVARWRTGELMARLTNDLSAVRMVAGPAIMYLVNTVAGAAFSLYFMLRIDARLTGLALLPMVGLPFVMIRLGRVVHDRFEAVQEHFGALTTRVQENLAGTRVVRAYRQERAEAERFAEGNEEYARRNVSLAKLNGVMNPAFGLLAGVGAAVVLGGGGSLVLRGAISTGAFVAFGLYLANLTWPLIALGWTTNLFQRGAASMGRIAEILDARPALAAPARARTLPPAEAGRALEFRNVSFHYPRPAGAADEGPDGAVPVRWVLRDVSFTVPAGATFGIVGPVGSGKSTLLDLVPRLYDPQEGEVLLDGVPVRELALGALRREIGAVPQESLLFSETIGANIRYGTDETGDAATDGTTAAPADRPNEGGVPVRLEEATSGAVEPTRHDLVVWAADIADLSATVNDFPGGYDTLLGERGVNLSGGQKQRAAIARALARRPAVVLLDDALSAVDTQTEAAILRGLRTALAGRTTLITTHRVSAVRDAAWILVLDEGRVVEEGTHDELVARGGRYAALARRQQLEAEVDATPDDADGAGDAPRNGAATIAADGDGAAGRAVARAGVGA